MMKLTFLGAAKTVTGSMYLLEAAGKRVLIDAGAFQGAPELEARNRDLLPVDLKSVSHLFLTHAHQDHIGRLPYLVKNGFAGAVVCTAPTDELGKLMLEDAAKLQEEDAARDARRRKESEQSEATKSAGTSPSRPGGPSSGRPLPSGTGPLFTTADVAKTASLFAKPVAYDETVDIGNISVTYRDAGHILGSAFFEVTAKEYGTTKRIIFSGDQGNLNKPVIADPQLPKMDPADYLLLESTYGDRNHRPMRESIEELKNILRATLPRGVALLPAFALERAQEILYLLREFNERRELPPCTVYLDSPLAINVTEVYLRFPGFLDEEARNALRQKGGPFRFPGVQFIHDVESSKELNNIEKGALIVAGSGMCTGGRIVHHLLHHLPHAESALVITGFQAEGTLGRKLVEGTQVVRIHGHTVPVKATIHTINGFSAHADRTELLRWSGALKSRPHIFLVHGEQAPMQSLADGLKTAGFSSSTPSYRETVDL
ncbi:MAG: MBL fold metallo-hydrolase RNA specificity domain-containing protein [bacterium]